MTISERIFSIMGMKNISVPDLSRKTGISRHTIYDWQRKNTNPGADKIMIICDALQVTPEELLLGRTGKGIEPEVQTDGTGSIDLQIIEGCRELSEAKKKRLIAYINMLQNQKE